MIVHNNEPSKQSQQLLFQLTMNVITVSCTQQTMNASMITSSSIPHDKQFITTETAHFSKACQDNTVCNDIKSDQSGAQIACSQVFEAAAVCSIPVNLTKQKQLSHARAEAKIRQNIALANSVTCLVGFFSTFSLWKVLL
jgi:hypothetical protein